MLPPAVSTILPGCSDEQLPNLAETTVVDVCIGPETFSVLFHGLRGSSLLFTAGLEIQRLKIRGQCVLVLGVGL